MNLSNFLNEFKRRNVYRVAVAYAVVSWLLIQAAAILLPTFEAPSWVMKVFVFIIALGFVIEVFIAWAFEMTPEGRKWRENILPDDVIPQWSKRKFATLIICVALLAAGLFVFQLLRSRSSANAASAGGKSIAVLPFENLSDEKGTAYFAEGIQDEILTRLAKIADLKVISHTSTEKYKSAPDNLRLHCVKHATCVVRPADGCPVDVDSLRETGVASEVVKGLHASVGIPNEGSRDEEIVSESESDDRAILIDAVR